jgi:hypothetical protein
MYTTRSAIRIAIFANATIALAVIKGSNPIRGTGEFAYLLLSILVPIPMNCDLGSEV